MQKIVINRCFGGFGLSKKAKALYKELAGEQAERYEYDIKRDCPHLVSTVEQLGAKANTPYSALKVVEIPDGVEWVINDYDGSETIDEVHRSWS